MTKAAKSRFDWGSTDFVSQAAYRQIRELIRSVCGIELGEEKHDFVAARLQPLLDKHALPDVDTLCRKLKCPRGETLLSELVDVVTTNHTYFNREQRHFDHVREVALPDAIAACDQRNSRKLRVWSAACSTGQEAYSLGIVLLESLGAAYGEWDAGVLATDLSARALEKARDGRYPNEELARVPVDHLTRYFCKDEQGQHCVAPVLRREVLFRRYNLVNPKIPFRSQFDIIFCRNVMLYFDAQSRMGLVHRLTRKLRIGGYLYIGAAETLPSLPDLEAVAPSIFRRLS